MAQTAGDPTRLVWRFPPWQPAALFLVTAVIAAWNLYGHPSPGARVTTLAVGAVALLLAVALVRMVAVVDHDGIAVRFLLRVQWVAWSEVKAIGLADVRGNETVRIVRTDDTQVDMPPSLLQPARPMSKPKANARLRFVVSQISNCNPALHQR